MVQRELNWEAIQIGSAKLVMYHQDMPVTIPLPMIRKGP